MRRDSAVLDLPRRSVRAARGRLLAAAALSAALGAGAGCTSNFAGQSSSYLIIADLKGANGAKPTELSHTLQSDVITIKDEQAGWFEDPGEVAFSLGLKDPGGVDSPSVPSTVNFITVDRYHVEYLRSDGRNVQGVDVPYAFDGAITVTVDGSGAGASLILVREQAKLEAPLLALRGGGGAMAISTIARVTFYGHDQAGRDVSATGQISVNFADWADPE